MTDGQTEPKTSPIWLSPVGDLYKFCLQKTEDTLGGLLFLWWISDIKKNKTICRDPSNNEHSCQICSNCPSGL